jgi:hypothetical protein
MNNHENHHHHRNTTSLKVASRAASSLSKTSTPCSSTSNTSALSRSSSSKSKLKTTVSSSTTTTSSIESSSDQRRRRHLKTKPDDTDLDVSLSNYSRINVSMENDNISVSCLSFKSDSPQPLHSSSIIIDEFSSSSSSSSQQTKNRIVPDERKQQRKATGIKVLTKKSSLNNIIQRRKLNVLSSINSNNSLQNQSLMSMLNSLSHQNNSSNISSLMSDLFLINLLHAASNKNLACVFSDFLKFASATKTSCHVMSEQHTQQIQRVKAAKNTPKQQKSTKSKQRGQGSTSRLNEHSSMSTSTSSLNYFDNLDSVETKSTSTRIEQQHLVSGSQIVSMRQRPNNGQLEMPNIDDPMLFIDNLYNQIVAGNKNGGGGSTRLSVTELMRRTSDPDSLPANLHHYKASIFSNNTFDINNDFSYIEMYSNGSVELNSLSENNTTIKEAGGVLNVKNKNLIDWNYEDNLTNLNLDVDQTDADCDDDVLEDEEGEDAVGFFDSQTTVISNEKQSECNCEDCEEKKLDNEKKLDDENDDKTLDLGPEDLPSETELVNGKTPSWLMLKLLNSCYDLTETKSNSFRQTTNDLKRHTRYLRPPIRSSMNRFLSLDDFNTTITDQELNASMSSMRSSTSTTYLPMKSKYHVAKKSYLFKPIESNLVRPASPPKKCCCDHMCDSAATTSSNSLTTTTTSRSYMQIFCHSLMNQVKCFVVSKHFILVPVILLLLNMKTRRNWTISSGSGVSLSNFMQTSSLTTAATASATAAATATLRSLVSFYNR